MTTNEDWIRMSERKPTATDLPVWYFGRPGHSTGFYRQLSNHEGWTHWRHAVDSVPEGPKEPTQREKDSEAFEKKYGKCPPIPRSAEDHGSIHWSIAQHAWNYALDYERAEILKLLYPCDAFEECGAVMKIRKRCTGGQP